jgi:hypothetical protein
MTEAETRDATASAKEAKERDATIVEDDAKRGWLLKER